MSKSAVSDKTEKKLRNLKPFKAGAEWNGNDKGRPKGSRNALAEAFIQDVQAKWEEKGAAALDEMIEDDPGAFVRVVAGILPKELVVKDEMSDVSDSELAAFLDAARSALGIRAEGGENASDPDRTKQARPLQTLQ